MSALNHQLLIRNLEEEDIPLLSAAFARQGWNKQTSQFEQYWLQQKACTRDVIVAEWDDHLAGYLTIQWASDYLPFREKKIPEIVDLNVLQMFQRQGIATALMEEAEKRIRSNSKYVGIGVGLTEDYGAAQVLYHNRNYVPDGRGVYANNKPVSYGEAVRVDDDLVIHLIKIL